MIVLLFLLYLRNDCFFIRIDPPVFALKEKLILSILIWLPTLSIAGTYILNIYDINSLLIICLLLIAFFILLISLFNKGLSSEFYIIVIFLFSISLISMFSFRSNHILGMDRHYEFYYFLRTLSSSAWLPSGNSTLDACLSVTILPTMFNSFLNLQPEQLYKILNPLVFSFTPIIIYIISKNYIGNFYSFLVACLFMSQKLFIFHQGGRTNIALFFCACTIMVLLSNDIDMLRKKVLLLVFITSIIVSHYSTAYIFFLIMIATYVLLNVFSKLFKSNKLSADQGKKLGFGIILLFFMIMFLWYSQLTVVPFITGIKFFVTTLVSFNNFFIQESRHESIPAMFGAGITEKTQIDILEFALSWIIIFIILIGLFISICDILLRHIRSSMNDGLCSRTSGHYIKIINFLNAIKNFRLSDIDKAIDPIYLSMAIIFAGILVLTVLLPYVSIGYSIDRTYLFSMLFLGIFFIIGSGFISKRFRMQPYFLILLILIPYFLCTTGVIHQISEDPQILTLNSKGFDFDIFFIFDSESTGAKWLEQYKLQRKRIYTDFTGGNILLSQGRIRDSDQYALVSDYYIKGYVYLRSYSIRSQFLIDYNFIAHPLSSYNNKILNKNKIYNSGGCEVLGDYLSSSL